jgi:hypothetical protein
MHAAINHKGLHQRSIACPAPAELVGAALTAAAGAPVLSSALSEADCCCCLPRGAACRNMVRFTGATSFFAVFAGMGSTLWFCAAANVCKVRTAAAVIRQTIAHLEVIGHVGQDNAGLLRQVPPRSPVPVRPTLALAELFCKRFVINLQPKDRVHQR